MYIKIRVYAGNKKETFTQVSKDHFEATVREKAERNMANKKIITLIAHHYSISITKVRLVTGHHSQSKILEINI